MAIRYHPRKTGTKTRPSAATAVIPPHIRFVPMQRKSDASGAPGAHSLRLLMEWGSLMEDFEKLEVGGILNGRGSEGLRASPREQRKQVRIPGPYHASPNQQNLCVVFLVSDISKVAKQRKACCGKWRRSSSTAGRTERVFYCWIVLDSAILACRSSTWPARPNQ